MKQREKSAAMPMTLLASALFLSMPGTASLSGEASARPLQTELQHLLKTHPLLDAEKKGIEEAAEGIRESRSGYYPKVTLSGEFGKEYVDSPTRRSSQQEDFFDNRRTTTLKVTQNVFDGFKTSSKEKIANLRKDESTTDLYLKQQSLLFDGVRSYLNVLKQSRLLDIAKKNERTLQNQLELESARVERGSGLAVDVLQAKSRLQLARERVVSLLGDLREAHSVYIELFNRPAVPAQMIMPKSIRGYLPETVESAVEIAKKRNPAITLSKVKVDIASEERTEQKSTFWPRIDLVGEGSWEKDADGIEGVNREGQVVVRAVWDIFDGFLSPARSAKAAAKYGAELDRRRNIGRDVQNKVRQAFSRYLTSGEQRNLLENAVNIASEVFEARKKLRQAGRESIINVLDAEKELNTARLRYTNATFNHMVASYRVLLQTGTLTPETLNLTR